MEIYDLWKMELKYPIIYYGLVGKSLLNYKTSMNINGKSNKYFAKIVNEGYS